MSLTTRVLIALCAGLTIGVGLTAWWPAALPATLAVADPMGALFVNAIRMTVVPLVVAGLITGVMSAPDAASIGRVGKRALPIAVAMILSGVLFAIVLGMPLLARLPLDVASTAALASSAAGAGATKSPSVGQWLVDLVPANPIRAAADGAMLPLIVFTLAFALALVRVDAERRATVAAFFAGLFDAMLVLVRWVLALAPFGVLALSIALGARTGIGAAGVVVSYVVVVSAASALFGALVLYPAAVLIGRVPLRTFAKGAAPAQAVAFSARSSLAALPAMIEGATTTLGLPREVSHFFLPLAASTFRAGAGVGLTIGVLFLARLYGITLGPAQLATIAITVVLTSFSIPGIPGGSIIGMVPVLLAAHVPIEGVGILLALDTIPDMFRTTVNVTGNMAAATIIAAPAVFRRR
ncbi:MAG: dicarboxylate/amino acid:cation symporter [Gemmatimonadaceae bacterium]